ncbi:guanylate kinase [Schaalia sp. lx-260]|uniref:guanylate kinase n=1 Tax=Schaalia sp. lx-260 TaxID=2899082 RepID=UPI001E41EF6B|nr:guanylate kinase [Schaalia sp. lx-260]MCD4549549.1 guanylate kinase [Schaalia sp. lx-260]
MASSQLIVLAGPTAVGKGTVTRALLDRYPQVVLTVSATTRPPRPDEIDGVHYHFISEEEFDALIDSGGMLEYAIVHGHHKYGTLRAPVEEALRQGRCVLLEIDLDGARQVRRSQPDALCVFLAPPSWEELERRLIGRGTENPQEQARRLQTARVEMAAQDEFDVTVTNDDIDTAVLELAHLMGLE